MMSTSKKIVIAGPGAGKTFNLINSLKDELPIIYSNPNKTCAIITYTNAAAEEIKERLLRTGSLPPNAFLGTFHSFLIQFLIEPFSHLILKYPLEKNYIDNIELPPKLKKWIVAKIDEKTYETPKKRQDAIDGFSRGMANKKIKAFSEKGIISFDNVLQISYDLIQNKNILRILSNKISHLFVDEYQDTHTYQHEFIMKLLEVNHCFFYCVGDPLQSIFKFSYGSSYINLKKEFRVKKLTDSPLLKLKDKYPSSVENITQNNRSTEKITSFLSKYTDHLGYKQESQNKVDIPVFVINSTSKEAICNKFYDLADKFLIKAENKKIKYLHLATNWNFWDEVSFDYNITAFDKGNHRKSTIIREIERCALGSIGLTKTEVYNIIGNPNRIENVLAFRSFCIKIYKLIRENKIGEEPQKEIRQLFTENFGYTFEWAITKEIDVIEISKSINDLNNAKTLTNAVVSDRYFSSIHSAKGLEATCVLVVARNKNELKSWFDFSNVIGENDTTRLGFVAFSRARKLLCISCLESLTAKDLIFLSKNNIMIC